MSSTTGSVGSFLGRFSTRFGAVLMVVAALGVGRLVTGWLPDDEVGAEPFERHATVGERLPLRYGDIEATAVEGGPQLSRAASGYTTPGLWLVVSLDYTPRHDERTPAFAQLRGGDGTTLTEGSRNAFQCDRANPGVTVRCGAAFEVAVESLPGAELLVALDNDQDQRHDDLAVIDLGIDRADVVRWKAVTEQLVFPTEREPGS